MSSLSGRLLLSWWSVTVSVRKVHELSRRKLKFERLRLYRGVLGTRDWTLRTLPSKFV